MTTRTITVEALAAALRSLYTAQNYLGHRAEDDARAIFAALPAEPAGATGLREALDVGIYPKSSPDGERTPWQDGWNAAVMEIGDRVKALAATPVGEGEP